MILILLRQSRKMHTVQELEQLAEEKGNEYLHQMLQEVDPVSARDDSCQ